MKTSHLIVLPALLVLAACGEPPCECQLVTASGAQSIACGSTVCAEGVGWQCLGPGSLSPVPGACLGPVPGGSCLPKSCAAAGAECGPISDGCGRTLDCGWCAAGASCGQDNRCHAGCTPESCGPGKRCDGAGQCVADPCAGAGAVCGAVGGVSCGSCPAGSTCAQTQRACIEKVATLPFAEYVSSSALVGDRLYAAGPPTKGATASDVVELSLSTRGVTRLADGQAYLSPLAQNGTHVFWAATGGLRKVAVGATAVESVPGLSGGCSSLLADAQRVFCGVGGDARYGVDYFGIQSVSVTGGASSWLVRRLNYPRMAKAGTLLFHLGTTDNMYSFAVLGVTDVEDGFNQSLVSGGILDSHFLLTDPDAYYFVRHDESLSTLVRVGYTASSGTDVLQGSGLLRQRTVSTGSEVWTVAEVGGAHGLYRVDLAGPGAPEKWLSGADLGGSAWDVESLWRSGQEWLWVSKTDVYRAFRP